MGAVMTDAHAPQPVVQRTPAPVDPALVPDAGDLVLPVEIIPIGEVTGPPRSIVKAVTGRAVRLPAGEYMVQVVLPVPGQSGVSSNAVRVVLAPGDIQKVDLQKIVSDTQLWVKAAAQVLQVLGAQIGQGIQAATPVVQAAAAGALSGLVQGVREHAGATPTLVRGSVVERSWLRDAAHELGRMATRALLAGRPWASVLPEWLARVVVGRNQTVAVEIVGAETVGRNSIGTGGGGVFMAPAAADTTGTGVIQADAAPSAPNAANAVADVCVLEGDPVALLQQHLGDASHARGQPLATLRVDGPPWQTAIDDSRKRVVVCGAAAEAIAIIPVDTTAGQTSVRVSLISTKPADIAGRLHHRAYPLLTLSFPAPSLDNLWAFMSASAFDESQQLATAHSEQISEVGTELGAKNSPFAALLSSYVLLRANHLGPMQKIIELLLPFQEVFPDIRVIQVELEARLGRHKEAVRLLAGMQHGQWPLLRPGVAYALQRLRLYRKLDADREENGDDDRLHLDEPLRQQLAALEEPLAQLAAAMDPRQLNLVLSRQVKVSSSR